jgi:hypothetical protein
MDSLLQRGEKLDDLVQKSDQLSAQSKMFYKQAASQNACCVYHPKIVLFVTYCLIKKLSVFRWSK